MTSRRRFLAGGLTLCLRDLARAVGSAVPALAVAADAAAAADAADPYAEARSRMLSEIDRGMRQSASTTGRPQLDQPVRTAMARVPRHRFVPPQFSALAYANRPLPIGHGQTISQPFIVGLMTQMLEPQPNHRVLEIGTGSGYQAAVLAELVARVYTIEIVRPLGERAAELLRELGYANVETRIGDGYLGWPEAAPFDGILVTAAPDEMPQPLIEQLAPGGRLIAPIGPQRAGQDLLLMRKEPDGRTVTRKLLPVRFVPLTRER